MGAAKIIAELTLGDETTGAAMAAEMAPLSAPELAANKLANVLMGAASGQVRGRLRVRVDDAVGVAAARTLTITGTSVIAGEYIEFVTPTGRHRVTAVASGAVDGDKTFTRSDTSNTAATNIRQAINTHPQLKQWIAASGSTSSVVITAKQTGTRGNEIVIVDGTGGGVGTVGALTGGKGAGAAVTASIAITHASLGATDTVTIGAQAFTARASGAVANEFNIGADATADAVALAAAINASAAMAGIVTASAASGTVTLTYQCDPRVAQHVRLATSDATAFTLTQPSTTLTLTNSFATRSYNLGVSDA